jgi:TonB family protein
MLQPDSHGTPSTWGEKSSGGKSEDKKTFGPVGGVVSSNDPRDVAEVARALAAHGGGAASYDLALDLVLNQVVEEARFATGATGAAIALARAGEMVCRATSGPDAPDLGVRVETTSGLSGACLQTGTIQQCGDTETDPRVNAEACRRLGVRSILVLPLADGPQPFGVLEVFSSLIDAFGDRDIRELQVLARRVVANKRGAEDGAAVLLVEVLAEVPAELPPEVPPDAPPDVPPGGVLASAVPPRVGEKASAPAIEVETSPELEASPEPEQRAESAAATFAEGGYTRRNDIWTAVLGILVIVTAVLLGLALGWRGAVGRGRNGGLNGGVNGGPSRESSTSSLETTANREGDSGLQQRTAAASHDSALPAETAPGGSSSPISVEPPNGELVVTQNGKVIYRLPAAEPAGIARSVAGASGSRELTGLGEEKGSASRLIQSRLIHSRLVHRVEPQYPTEARAQKIQGVVTLDVQIGSEGAVHNIAVVDGNPLLAEAAVAAVRQWRYEPYAVDGRPVEMQTRIRVRFTLPPS